MSDPQRVNGVIAQLESIRQRGDENPRPEGAPPDGPEEGAPSVKQPVDDAIAMLQQLQSAFSLPEGPESSGPGESGRSYDDKKPRLFGGWTGSGFKPGDTSITSPPVGDIARLGVWKFTWVVRLHHDDPKEKWAHWDPHIIGEP
jgi:hypothetical protein